MISPTSQGIPCDAAAFENAAKNVREKKMSPPVHPLTDPFDRTWQDFQVHYYSYGVSSDLQNKRLILTADLLLDRWSRAGFHET